MRWKRWIWMVPLASGCFVEVHDDPDPRCRPGYSSICGGGRCISVDRLCDGYVDCRDGGDEALSRCDGEHVLTWYVGDFCDDGRDVEWRVWSDTRGWVWPGPDEVFVTPGYGLETAESVACAPGESICFGASSGDLAWGVGIDDSQPCDDCCFSCDGGFVDYGWLEC